jgi:hypothetical protein
MFNRITWVKLGFVTTFYIKIKIHNYVKKVFFVLPSHDQLENTGKKQDSGWKNLLVPSMNSLITDTM